MSLNASCVMDRKNEGAKTLLQSPASVEKYNNK